MSQITLILKVMYKIYGRIGEWDLCGCDDSSTSSMAGPLTLLPTVHVVVLEMKTFLLSMKALTSVYNVCVDLLHIRHEDRIAQLICERIVYPDVCGVENLDETVHGSGGFGSSSSN
jgi:hypothetical protein